MSFRVSLGITIVVVLLAGLFFIDGSQVIGGLKQKLKKKSNADNAAVPGAAGLVNVDAFQLRGLQAASKRLVKRVQRQIEINNENLAECYEQLGKYTRLMIVHANEQQQEAVSHESQFRNSLLDNLTRLFYQEGAAASSGPNALDETNKNFKSYIMFIIQNELAYYLLAYWIFNISLPFSYQTLTFLTIGS
jgi:hypothetical protein